MAKRTSSTSRKKNSGLFTALNTSLAHLIDLKLQTKQAHWNIRGENFIALHELFDHIAKDVDEYADLIAERIRQLGGCAEGTLQLVSKTSTLPPSPASTFDPGRHILHLAHTLKLVSDALKGLIDLSDDSGDLVTGDICTEIARGLDKSHWLVASHL